MSTKTDDSLALLNAAMDKNNATTNQRRGEAEASPPTKTERHKKRGPALGAINDRNRETVLQLHHDPSKIRMWDGHNRIYDDLNEENCADLIEGFKTTGQQYAAVVRILKGDSDYDYEVITGARRHWTAAYLKKKLLIEPRKMDDEEAFILQDLENRDRKDVSDYERAVDYKRALDLYYEGIPRKMANRLNIDESNFAKLLYLAELPSEIVSAYNPLGDLKIHHGVYFKQVIDDPKRRRRLMDEAKRIREVEFKIKPNVFTLLKKASSPIEEKNQPKPSYGAATLQKQTKSQLTFSVQLPKGESIAEIESIQADISRLLTDTLVAG